MGDQTRSCVIAHLSDLHTGSQYFVPNLLDRTLVEVNDLGPDIVVVTGDLTNMGYRQEFREAREYLDRLTCPDVLVVPGNHDSRNVGYAHFERLFATRETIDPQERGDAGGRRFHRAGPRLRPHRPAPVPVDPGSVHGEPGRLQDLHAPPPPAAHPGHRDGSATS